MGRGNAPDGERNRLGSRNWSPANQKTYQIVLRDGVDANEDSNKPMVTSGLLLYGPENPCVKPREETMHDYALHLMEEFSRGTAQPA